MSKHIWLEMVKYMEEEIVEEVVSSLKASTGCNCPEYDDTEDVLYLVNDGKMFWTRASRGNLSEKVYRGDAIVLFSHPIEALGCYGCENECLEFDKKPNFSKEEIDYQIKIDEILDQIYMNVPQ